MAIGKGKIKVTVEFDVDGIVDDEFKDHLEQEVASGLRMSCSEGNLTPQSAFYEYTTVDISKIESEIIGVLIS